MEKYILYSSKSGRCALGYPCTVHYMGSSIETRYPSTSMAIFRSGFHLLGLGKLCVVVQVTSCRALVLRCSLHSHQRCGRIPSKTTEYTVSRPIGNNGGGMGAALNLCPVSEWCDCGILPEDCVIVFPSLTTVLPGFPNEQPSMC